MKWLALVAFAALALPAQAWAYGDGVQKNVPVTMRDGTVLRADIHYPANADGSEAKGPFPVLLTTTPYGKSTTQPDQVRELAGYAPELIHRGYIQVLADVRGTGASGGSFDLFQPVQAEDAVQLVDWAARLPNTTGKVGMIGLSYLGISQLFAAAEAGRHSPLKAIFPMMAANDPYRELLMDGGLLNAQSDGAYMTALAGLQVADPLIDLYADPKNMLEVLADHAGSASWEASTTLDVALAGDKAYDDQWWATRSPASVLKKVVRNRIPAYLVGGAYDVFQAGEPINFKSLQDAYPGPPSGRYQLLWGPWYHANAGAGIELWKTQLAWFDRWLKGKRNGIDKTTRPLHVIDPGGGTYDAARFPIDGAKQTSYALGSGTRTLAYDGATVPCDRATEQWAIGVGEVALNQLGLTDPCAASSPAAGSDPDTLTWTSEPFASGTTVAGPISATITASATTTDTSWTGTLYDVAPDGSQVNITAGSLLGSFRAVDTKKSLPGLPWHPYTKASKQPVTPGAATRYDIALRPSFRTLAAGHRLRLVVATGDAPHVIPLPSDLPNLVGGVYTVDLARSSLSVPLMAAHAPD